MPAHLLHRIDGCTTSALTFILLRQIFLPLVFRPAPVFDNENSMCVCVRKRDRDKKTRSFRLQEIFVQRIWCYDYIIMHIIQ